MSKFIVSSSALLKVLTPLAGVIVNNPVVPALENFLFAVSAGLLTLTASDLEVSISTTLLVETGKTEDYAICVPARLLLDTLKALPDQPVTFSIDLDEHRVELRSANGLYKLSGENAGDYPRVPVLTSIEPLELPGSVVKRAIAHTIFGISSDELRPAMTGVLVERMVTQLGFVATDGHRLLRYRRTDIGAGTDIGTSIIPRKAWGLLGKLVAADAPVQMRFGQSQAVVVTNGLTLTTRLIDERYPDYENVIPIENPNKLVINRRELLNSVRRLNNYTNRTTHQIAIGLHAAEVVLSAEDIDFSNEARETLTAQYDGQDLTIGFNARFLNEVLTQLDGEEVQVAMSHPSRAAMLSPTIQEEHEDVLMLVMPVMLNNAW